jgi:hypothetical protein
MGNSNSIRERIEAASKTGKLSRFPAVHARKPLAIGVTDGKLAEMRNPFGE